MDALRRKTDHIPELSLVALWQDRLVGHILFSPITIKSTERVTPALAPAPMAVHPEYQQRGIGMALVREGLAAARRLGHRLVVVVGHPEYYPRFGFVPARAYEIELPFPCPDEAFMVQELVVGALEGVSGTVCYPREFNAV